MEKLQLTAPQLAFFDTFGYLSLPGLLDDCIDALTEAFEAVWVERQRGYDGRPPDGTQRACIVPFADQHERLCALLDDPRIEGLLSSLLGADFNYMGSDGNYYVGDTGWHSDGWREPGKPLFVKVALYLDPLQRDNGCLRVIPGSHQLPDRYGRRLEDGLRNAREQWDIDGSGVPAVAVETRPGDVVVFNHNLKHASFGGGQRRRMFTLNNCQRIPRDQLQVLKAYIGAHARYFIERHYGEKMVKTAGPKRMVHLEQVLENDGHLAALTAKARAERTT